MKATKIGLLCAALVAVCAAQAAVTVTPLSPMQYYEISIGPQSWYLHGGNGGNTMEMGVRSQFSRTNAAVEWLGEEYQVGLTYDGSVLAYSVTGSSSGITTVSLPFVGGIGGASAVAIKAVHPFFLQGEMDIWNIVINGVPVDYDLEADAQQPIDAALFATTDGPITSLSFSVHSERDRYTWYDVIGVTPVPEPTVGAIALLFIPLFGAIMLLRRRKLPR